MLIETEVFVTQKKEKQPQFLSNYNRREDLNSEPPTFLYTNNTECEDVMCSPQWNTVCPNESALSGTPVLWQHHWR